MAAVETKVRSGARTLPPRIRTPAPHTAHRLPSTALPPAPRQARCHSPAPPAASQTAGYFNDRLKEEDEEEDWGLKTITLKARRLAPCVRGAGAGGAGRGGAGRGGAGIGAQA